jgi:hypothetical protein
MAVHLKDDWKPVGKNPSARMLADWMNTVARLFNLATVPSGGTAQATATGFQIEIDGNESNGANKDHSFRPTQITATTATVTPGTIYDRFGTAHNVSGAIDWPVGGVIDFTIVKRFYVQLRYLSSPPESIGQFDEMQWVGTAGAFPDFRPSEFTENIPIMEFPDNTWASLIRRQTSQVYLNAFRHNSLFGLQGGTAPNEYHHLTAAQAGLIDTHLPPAYPPQDPDQPWPGDEYPIQDPDEPWPAPGDHATLTDVSAQTVGDDHRGNRTAAAAIAQGSPSVNGHPYIHANGDATRNRMTTAAYIGDDSNAKSIWPSGRQLMNGATVVVDWILRKLSGGVWTVTDTTAAGTGTGALVVDGGIYAAEGVHVAQGSATYGGNFTGTGGNAYIVTGSEAALFAKGIDQSASMCNGTYAVSADGDDGKINAEIAYYTNGTKVVGAQGAAVADATGAGDVVAQLNSLLAKLRTHGLIAT